MSRSDNEMYKGSTGANELITNRIKSWSTTTSAKSALCDVVSWTKSNPFGALTSKEKDSMAKLYNTFFSKDFTLRVVPEIKQGQFDQTKFVVEEKGAVRALDTWYDEYHALRLKTAFDELSRLAHLTMSHKDVWLLLKELSPLMLHDGIRMCANVAFLCETQTHPQHRFCCDVPYTSESVEDVTLWEPLGDFAIYWKRQ